LADSTGSRQAEDMQWKYIIAPENTEHVNNAHQQQAENSFTQIILMHVKSLHSIFMKQLSSLLDPFIY